MLVTYIRSVCILTRMENRFHWNHNTYPPSCMMGQPTRTCCWKHKQEMNAARLSM